MNVYIFDLDHTVCKVNTSFRFGLYLLRSKALSIYKVPRLITLYLLHKIGFLKLETLHRAACKHVFKGMERRCLENHVRDFFNRYYAGMLNNQITALLEDVKSKGAYTVLLSSSPDFLVAEAAKRLGFNEWAGTEYLFSENGGIGKLMGGGNKAEFLGEMMKRLRVEKEEIAVLTDSYADLPLLEMAGCPIVINPDRKLRKLAKKRNWTSIVRGRKFNAPQY